MSLPRTYPAVVTYAQEKIRAEMRAGGRTAPTAADTDNLRALIAQLLWMVPARDGGFMGLDEAGLDFRVKRTCVTKADAVAAMYSPGEWPADEARAA